MAHKTYVSFKAEDIAFRDAILDMPKLDCLHKRFTTPINSNDEDYILERIRDDYLSDSTVTILLIGEYGAENRGAWEQRFIKRELQASLYHGKYNTKNGILGVVLPHTVNRVFTGDYTCWNCGGSHNGVDVNDATTITEFSYNYYIPNGKCAHSEEDRYCVLATWNDFCNDPTAYVERAFQKRSAPIASETKVRP
jgi:hypothetical protein